MSDLNVTLKVADTAPQTVTIGRVGDYDARRLVITLSDYVDTFGAAESVYATYTYKDADCSCLIDSEYSDGVLYVPIVAAMCLYRGFQTLVVNYKLTSGRVVPVDIKCYVLPSGQKEKAGTIPTIIQDLADKLASLWAKFSGTDDSGEDGQVWTKSASGAGWSDPTGGGGSVTVDSELSTTSPNPVQNKVITAALSGVKEDFTNNLNIETTARRTADENLAEGIQTALNSAHSHDNKSLLDSLTDALVSAWNGAVTWISTNGANVLSHLSDSVKHITSAERTTWNAKQNALSDADKQAIADLHQDKVTSVNGQTGDVKTTFVVTITSTKDDEGNVTYSADKTYDEIIEKHNAGFSVLCSAFGMYLNISSIADSFIIFGSATFSEGAGVFGAYIAKDGEVDISTKFIDNHHLTFKNSSDEEIATYDGSEEVEVVIPDNTFTDEYKSEVDALWADYKSALEVI